MAEFLIGIMYHDRESYALWQRGAIEDYESSTGLFVEADSPDDALDWGRVVGRALLEFADPGTTCDWDKLYRAWHVESPETSHWSHCLAKFQHVRPGQMPDLARMVR